MLDGSHFRFDRRMGSPRRLDVGGYLEPGPPGFFDDKTDIFGGVLITLTINDDLDDLRTPMTPLRSLRKTQGIGHLRR